MPLIIQVDKGRWCPTVLCDHCRQRIDTAAQGNYQYVMGTTAPPTVPIYFTHKTCCRAFEARHQLPDGQWWGWTPLECLPIYLMGNLQINQKNAREWAQVFASI